ncbi:MAG TPA: hypothetical protein VIH99_01850 [Bdellovibrionota bacterium]|jgi:hypothetical protein
MHFRISVFGLLFLSACSRQEVAHSTAPIVVADSGKKSELRGLETKSIAGVREQPYFRFAWAGRSFRIAHGRWKIKEEHPQWNKAYGWGPVVWVKERGRERVLDLRAEFPSHYVSNVFQDEASGRIYLFLDFGIEGPAGDYKVWITEDKGEHWFAGENLKRPPFTFPPAALENFFVDKDGNGAAWFKIEAASLPPSERGGQTPATEIFYRVTTSDGGRSWSYEGKPAFFNLVHQEEERHY